MARLFNDAASQSLQYNGAVLNTPPITMACWGYSDDATIAQAAVSITHSVDGNPLFELQFAGNAGGDPILAVARDDAGISGIATSTAGYTANTWCHACAVFAAGNDHRAYVNGGNRGNDATAVGAKTLDRSHIGEFRGTLYFSGRLAEVALWSAALTDDEVAILGKGYSPLFVRPQSLVAYWPLIRDTDQDWVGGYNMTPVNAPTVADHPPQIAYPRPRSLVWQAAVSPPTPSVTVGPPALPRPRLLIWDFEGNQIEGLERAVNRRWSSHYGPDGSGFGYLMFNLDRKIGYDYRDIQIGYRVQLRKYLSTVLFDGQIRKVTESHPDRIEVTCLGWNVLFGDDALNWVFCDTRYMLWKGSETPSGSFTPDKFDYDLQDRIQFKPRRGVDYLANDYSYVRYTFKFGEVAERIKFDWNVALPGAWPGKLEVRDSNGVVLWSRTTTGNSTGEDFATTGSPTYIEVRFYVTSAGENTAEDGTVYGRLTNVKVYGVEDATLDGAVIAKKIVSQILTQSYHGLSADVSQVASPALVLEPSAFDTDLSLTQIMQWLCQFGDLDGDPLAWGVEMSDRLRMFLEVMDLTTIRYKILRGTPLQAQVSGDMQSSYQKAYGVYSDAIGEVQRTADRASTSAMTKLGGYARRRALSVDGATSEAQALVAVDLYLAENDLPKVTSSFTIRGNIHSPALASIPFDEIKAGGMVQAQDFRAREATLTPNDFRDSWTTFQLVGVEVDEDAHSVRLIPAGDRAGFEQYMALLAQMAGGG